jgi:hypothetical protein
MREGVVVRARRVVKEHPFPGGWLALGLLTCGVLFRLGGQAWDQPDNGLATIAMLGAFVAVWVGPALLAVTILWGGFVFLRWFCRGAFD